MALSKLRSAVTVTLELPGPMTLSSVAWIRLCMDVWKSAISWVRVPAMPASVASGVSTLPVESATVTSSGDMPSMLEATRWTIAWTSSADSVVPTGLETRTDAVAGSCWSEKTCLAGSARCTTAVSTSSSASTVLEQLCSRWPA